MSSHLIRLESVVTKPISREINKKGHGETEDKLYRSSKERGGMSYQEVKSLAECRERLLFLAFPLKERAREQHS